MRNLRFLLRLAGGTVLALGPTIGVVACNNNEQTEQIADISTGVVVNNLTVQANPANTYQQLNLSNYLLSEVAMAINAAKGTSVVGITDFYLTNDQEPNRKQDLGSTIRFTVHGFGTQIKGTFSFTTTLTKINISFDVQVPSVNVPANTSETYQNLTNSKMLGTTVANAIYQGKRIRVSLGNDFVLSTDQDPNAKQMMGAKVLITATATGNTIIGSTNFTITLGKANIANDININDPMTQANITATYGSLNNDPGLLQIVVNAINQAKNTSISASDITLTNDQNSNELQVLGQQVVFTVSANDSSESIFGSFNFTDTLSKINISDVTVPTFGYEARVNNTYGSLNTDNYFKTKVANAINSAKNTQINNNDFTLTNDQTATANQTPGTTVNFLVTANSSSKQIGGQMRFAVTLGAVSLRSVTLSDPNSAANPTQTYASLNTNTNLINTITNAISTQLGVNISSSDITLSNNKTGNQTPGTPVVFTVTGTGQKITDSFSFTNTLGKVNISSGVTVNNPATAYTGTTYAALINNQTLINYVAAAINTSLGTNVTGNDFSLSTTQTGAVIPNTTIVITATANATSNQITGSFTFNNTIGRLSISSGITISDPLTVPDSAATYGALNTNSFVLNLINNTIYNATGYLPVNGVDYNVTNNQTATANQVAGTVVTITVTGIGKLNGSFTFTNTLTKVVLSTQGVAVPDLRIVANNYDTYAALNTTTRILNAVISAINTRYQTNITTADFTLGNNQAGSPVSGATVTFTITAAATSTKISGSCTFVQVLL